MPLYPNPYGPANQIGAGLQNIARSIFKASDYELDNRRIARQTEEQAAERLAHAQERQARMGLLNAQTAEQEQQNAARTPEALAQYGADAAGLSRQVYDNINTLPPSEFAGPYEAYNYSPQQFEAARIGKQLAAHFAANNEPNPEQFAKASGINQVNNDRARVVAGQLGADIFGDSVAAAEGKPRYGLESGIQFSNQVGGRTAMTPLGNAKVSVEQALATLRASQSRAANAQANLANTRAAAGGFASRPTGAVSAGKRVALSKNDMAVMENQLADLAGTEFKKIDPQSRAAIISRASALAVDPESEFHRNPAGAMEAAVSEMAPDGFEDSAGVFSSAKFVPKGGGAPQRQAAPKQSGSGGLPSQARSALKEGVVTKFGNGQTWTLQGGVPVRMQ